MTLQQKAQEYVEASGLSLKTDKGEQAYNAYIAGVKESFPEIVQEMADAIKYTLDKFNGEIDDEEYYVSFLYPANNKAYQMLLKALTTYQQ